MVELREQERAALSALESLGGEATTEQITQKSNLPDAAIARATMTLHEKKLVSITERKHKLLSLSKEGKLHAEKGLPERRLINALEKLGGKSTRNQAFQNTDLEKRFALIALGWAQQKHWTTLDSKTDTLKAIAKPEEGDDEKLLRLLHNKKKTSLEELGTQLSKAVHTLKSRRLLDVEEKTTRLVELTETGREALKIGARATAEVTQLTQELIISGKWRKVKLRKYDIEAPVARAWPGKKHPYLAFLDEVREKLVTLGFREMTGTLVELAFWNFDALYTPQDHPARQTDGIYYVKSPSKGTIDAPKSTIAKVKATHENGWTTGSTGWGGEYSEEEARRLVLRGHGTCLSARTLASKSLEIPGRYFSIARCYRPEVPDRTHLIEFNQVEGIVIDKDLTLRDLLGVLSKFATEIAGADRIKLKPDYFPFTEPSVELSAYKEGYGWIEFGGSGIFRPEVTLPLDIKDPVIAWGLGVDRLYMMHAGVSDIQYIFPTDLDWIRRKAVT